MNQNNVNNNVVDLYKNNNHDMVNFLFKNNLVAQLSQVDQEGNSIFHHVVKNNNVDLLNTALSWVKDDTSRVRFLNMQNNQGNTVLHLAVQGGDHQLATLLENYGARRNIANNDNFEIDVTESESRESFQDIFAVLDDIEHGISGGNSMATDNFETDMPDRLSAIDTPMSDDVFGGQDNINESMDQAAIESVQYGGAPSIMGVRVLESEDLTSENLMSLGSDTMSGGMDGGAKGKSRNGSNKRKRTRRKSASRVKTDEIRKDVLEKIMKEQKVDELDALSLRAALYKMIKEKFADKNNLEKHQELAKHATKTHIAKLDKKVVKEIKDHIKTKRVEREKRLQQRKKK
jgi:hypothetical protein